MEDKDILANFEEIIKKVELLDKKINLLKINQESNPSIDDLNLSQKTKILLKNENINDLNALKNLDFVSFLKKIKRQSNLYLIHKELSQYLS